MWRNTSLLFVLVVWFVQPAVSQDNLKFMHYNLLWFGKYTSYCSESNNDYEDKTAALKEILEYTRPDVFTVNELDGEGAYPIEEGPEGDGLYLLNNALNVEGTSQYRMAPFDEVYTANAVFYNANKLTLHAHHPVAFQINNSKIFNGYTFYYNARDLSSSTDTTFFTVFVVHLKAGSAFDDQQLRDSETQVLMDYLEQNFSEGGNYILAGDLNVYRGSEDAFQNLVDPASSLYRFNDPIDQVGDWHANVDYRYHHTQSTHFSGDCHSGGGMDDRFDFILLSDAIMNGSGSVSYILDSYQATGQDGSYFDRALNIENNASVSSDIARALYTFSDHLPVSLQLRVSSDPAQILAWDTIYHSPDQPVEGDSVSIYAQLTDTEKVVEQLRVHWGEESGQYSGDTIMALEGNYYTTKLPPVDGNTTVYYRVKGYDSSQTVAQASAEYSYRVDELDVAVSPGQSAGETLDVIHPVTGHLRVLSGGNLQGDYVVEIGDLTGRTLIRKQLHLHGTREFSVDVRALDPGLYWIRIHNGAFREVRKFIKQ